jgi:hypothetical protein
MPKKKTKKKVLEAVYPGFTITICDSFVTYKYTLIKEANRFSIDNILMHGIKSYGLIASKEMMWNRSEGKTPKRKKKDA